MFISMRRAGYDRDGSQVASGRFLILCQPRTDDIGAAGAPIRALVRFASLHQLGHFMMGCARVGRETITLSGSYGSDGLPCTVSRAVYDRAVPVPPELTEAWNKGGGWNGAGAEAEAMRAWAKATFPVARRR